MSRNPVAWCKNNKSAAKVRRIIEKEWNGTRLIAQIPVILPQKTKFQPTMKQLSRKMPIFVPWFQMRPRHRGERLSFDPSENLENSTCTGERSESRSSCSSIYTAHSLVESAHIYTCRCELIFILTYTGIPEPSD